MCYNEKVCDNWLYRYTLAQEHADVINLHDWYQSFKTILIPKSSKAKQKSKSSSKSKKRKDICEEPEAPAEALIQYPFLVKISNRWSTNVHPCISVHAARHLRKCRQPEITEFIIILSIP